MRRVKVAEGERAYHPGPNGRCEVGRAITVLSAGFYYPDFTIYELKRGAIRGSVEGTRQRK